MQPTHLASRFVFISIWLLGSFGCGPRTAQTPTTLTQTEDNSISLSSAARTPIKGATPTLDIISPKEQAFVGKNVKLKVALKNWELQPAPGQHVHLIVDNHPYIALRDLSKPIALVELVREKLGVDLERGWHTLRMFPSRATHESVKSEGAAAIRSFYLSRRHTPPETQTEQVVLTYSRPKGCHLLGEPILLDFYLYGATELTSAGYAVRYVIDGTTKGVIQEWTPHYLHGLSEGEHTIELLLIDQNQQPVPGEFNHTQRTIQVASRCN